MTDPKHTGPHPVPTIWNAQPGDLYQITDFYLRHGRLYSPAPLFLPDSGPALWPMWRDPAPGRPTAPAPVEGAS